MADGGMRDAMSLLDQCASATTGELTAEKVYGCLGIAGEQKAGELMGYIARRETKNALTLFNRLYAEGKDLAALLDELACLARDLLILKTAPDAGLAMLSGVADDKEALALSREISHGELVRIMNLLQQTMASFTRSASRRMDAELCLLNLCQPELSLDAKALNARLTKLEEKIRTGDLVRVAAPVEPAKPAKEEDMVDDELPPPPDDADAPPMEAPALVDATPLGFWTDLAAAVRQEVKPPVLGFFTGSPNGPVQAVVQEDKVVLCCSSQFTEETINKPEILEIVARKAGALLGRNVIVKVIDGSAMPQKSEKMDKLLSFGRAHSDVIKIKE
jgi:DNA polymerase-3 subunit gamma/tau